MSPFQEAASKNAESQSHIVLNKAIAYTNQVHSIIVESKKIIILTSILEDPSKTIFLKPYSESSLHTDIKNYIIIKFSIRNVGKLRVEMDVKFMMQKKKQQKGGGQARVLIKIGVNKD